MTTTKIGRQAEKLVSRYLSTRGYEILGQNWKTKTCEIDIIAKRGDTIYFVEVKYRKSLAYGDGFDYITSVKVKQMAYAAMLWICQNNWHGKYELIGASVVGPRPGIALSRIAS